MNPRLNEPFEIVPQVDFGLEDDEDAEAQCEPCEDELLCMMVVADGAS